MIKVNNFHTNTKKTTLILVIVFGFLSGCSPINYTLQALGGHMELLSKSKPIEKMLADRRISDELKKKLLVARDARNFAIKHLGLPSNSSYTKYADIDREYVVWNVIVASEFSLELEKSCFPIAGCVDYRGFYKKISAEKYVKNKK